MCVCVCVCMFQLGMTNSSFMYHVDAAEAEVATPYQPDDNGELRAIAWETNAQTGEDWGPAGEHAQLCCFSPKWFSR